MKGKLTAIGLLCSCLVLGVSFTVYSQTVSGTVTDQSTNNPLIGVNILVKGTNQGTITNSKGEYKLTVSSLQDTLIFSYIGYKQQTVPVNDRTTIDVELEPLILSGQQMVVIGYGTQKKRNLTGSIASITPNDFNEGVVTTVNQALKGRIPGVRISEVSAGPTRGNYNIRIRGASSITAGNDPLFVIDGQPISNASTINPAVIKSIEVLKDAAATAIYGARGGNGVILITTKRGGNHEVRVNYNGKGGIQTIFRTPDILSAKEYMKFMNDLADARGEPTVFTESEIADIGQGTNWTDYLTRKAMTTNHNLSISGGSDKTTYFISGNYEKQEGVVKQTSDERYAFRLNLNTEISEKLTYDVHLTASLNNDSRNVEGSGNTSNGPYYLAQIYDPTLNPYKPDGSFNNSNYLTPANPIAQLGSTSKTKTNRVWGNMSLDYQIIPNLSATFKVGVDRIFQRTDDFTKSEAKSANNAPASAYVGAHEAYNYLLEYTMHYQNQLSEIAKLKAVAGITYQDFTNRNVSSSTQDFPSEVIGTNNLGLGNRENATVGSSKNEHELLSYLGRVHLTLFDKLLVTGAFRIDGSSRFGENNKFGYFPSVAVGYHLDDESFIPDQVNQLKIRASWGQTGNQKIGNYAYLPTFRAGQQALLGDQILQGTTASRIPNPDLKWETTIQYDIGIDFGLFENRISGSVDYFIKDTEDLLLNFPIPHSTGFSSILRNIGSMRNKGLEVALKTTNILNNNFTWRTSFNFTAIDNKVTSIGGLDRILTGYYFTVPNTIIKPGMPLDSYYTYKVIGLFQNQEEVKNSAQPNSRRGNPKLLDVDQDNDITDADRMVVGSPWPDFTYGISSNMNYKNISLSFNIAGQVGAELLNGNLAYGLHPQATRYNRLSKLVKDRWTPENRDAKWPTPIDPNNYAPSKITSKVVQNASFIRLQDVRLSYDFPIKSTKGFIRKATVFVTGQNLLLITPYGGRNPEAKRNVHNNVWIDRNTYPMARTYLLGINLKF